MRFTRVAIHLIVLSLAIALIVGLGGKWGWIVGVAAGGLLAGITCSGTLSAAIMGGLAGLLGTGCAVASYGGARAVDAVQMYKAARPWGKTQAEFLGPLIKSSSVNGHWGTSSIALVIVVAVGVAAVAAATAWFISRAPEDRARTRRAILGTAAVTVVAFALIVASFSSPFRYHSKSPLPAGSYSFDAGIYMNTYFNVLEGTPYYASIVKAGAGDKRLQDEKSVRGGKFYGWAYSSTFIRMPWTFYIWRVLAPTGLLWYMSLLVCVIVLYAVWWGLYPALSARAALVPPVLFPLLMMCTAWLNMYFPDWWAALAILLSMMLQIRKRYVAAGVLALLAGIFRDVALIWLLLLLINAIVRGWQGDISWRRMAALYSAFMTGFFVLYALHLRVGAPYVGAQPDALDVGGVLGGAVVRSFRERFFVPAAYMMQAYGTQLDIRIFSLFMFAQLPGWWLVLKRDRAALWPILAFGVFWIAFTVTIGATSNYWGQMYTPVAVVGTAALLALAAPNLDAAEPAE